MAQCFRWAYRGHKIYPSAFSELFHEDFSSVFRRIAGLFLAPILAWKEFSGSLPPQGSPRLVPKCAPGCEFWYFRRSQENNISDIWISEHFCTTAWWKNERLWDGGWGRLNSTQKPYIKTNLHIWGISLKQTFTSFLRHIGWQNQLISLWAMTDNVKLHWRTCHQCQVLGGGVIYYHKNKSFLL